MDEERGFSELKPWTGTTGGKTDGVVIERPDVFRLGHREPQISTSSNHEKNGREGELGEGRLR